MLNNRNKLGDGIFLKNDPLGDGISNHSLPFAFHPFKSLKATHFVIFSASFVSKTWGKCHGILSFYPNSATNPNESRYAHTP